MSNFGADLRYAGRQLRRHRGYTLTAVLVLGLGIGVGTAMFNVLNAVLLRQLPYANPSQLVTLSEPSSMPSQFWGTSHPDIEDWRAQSHSLQSIAYFQWGMATLEGREQSLEVAAEQASPNLFTTLGRPPARGRSFTPADVAAHADVAIVSHALWEKWFHGAPALGQSLRLGGKDYTVVGILPAGLRFPFDNPAEVWTPFIPPNPDTRDGISVHAIGRLRPGVTPAAAQHELSRIQARIAAAHGNLHLANRVAVQRYQDALVGKLRPALWAVALAVGLVWLIACASVAGLLLTRLAGQRHELAVRAALGAGRVRLARQLLAESLLLGALAALAGCALAGLTLALLQPFLHQNLPYVASLGLNPAVLAALVLATLLSVVLIGLAPALGAARTPAAAGLQDRSLSASAGQTRLRHGLVVVEIALALLLLSGAGLLLRTLYALNQVPLGFTTENIVTTRLNIPSADYAHRSVYQYLEAPLLDKVRALPGVADAAVSSVVPLAQHINIVGSFGIVGKPNLPDNRQPTGDMRFTSPGYEKVFAIPVLRGRFFDPSLDTSTSQLVAVINHALAVKYFPGQNPIGQQLKLGDQASATIIGELADVHVQGVAAPPGPVVHFSTTQLAPDAKAADFFYTIGAQFAQLAVRTHVPAATLDPELRAALHSIAPGVSLSDFSSMRQLVTRSKGDQIFAARMLSLFGLTALLIALAGLYGLLAYTVAQRRREMGIRLALGASPAQIRSHVLGSAVRLIALGIVLGLGLALLLAQVAAAYLYGVAPRDPLTLAGAAALLAACALGAAFLPARRASLTPPAVTLRTE